MLRSLVGSEMCIRDRINTDQINIEASTETGAIFGFQSLYQLMNLNLKNGVVKLQNQVIKDSPRFKYRGMHLDVGRHMYPVSFIKASTSAKVSGTSPG